jgi:hypothetical protein
MQHAAFCFSIYTHYLRKLPKAKSTEMGSLVADFYSDSQCCPSCSTRNGMVDVIVDFLG